MQKIAENRKILQATRFESQQETNDAQMRNMREVFRFSELLEKPRVGAQRREAAQVRDVRAVLQPAGYSKEACHDPHRRETVRV